MLETCQYSNTPADRLYNVLLKKTKKPIRVSYATLEQHPDKFLVPAETFPELESLIARINADKKVLAFKKPEEDTEEHGS